MLSGLILFVLMLFLTMPLPLMLFPLMLLLLMLFTLMLFPMMLFLKIVKRQAAGFHIECLLSIRGKKNFHGVLLPTSPSWIAHRDYLTNAFVEARANNEKV